jgi:2-polyprenyl-3-methyl-5-hydroxy-6-metoxy-1,4-benzoquinol methylase
VKRIHESAPLVTLGPSASYQYLRAPEHLAMVLARYRAASALIGDATNVLEVGCGEGIGAGILAQARACYRGIDTDEAAIEQARAVNSVGRLNKWSFAASDALLTEDHAKVWDAVVSLDVIEHIPAEQEEEFLRNITRWLRDDGICVIGTPNATAHHLASAASQAGHINNYDHERLSGLMRRHFKRVQSFGMQDVSLHLGHPEMRHYLVFVGFGIRGER